MARVQSLFHILIDSPSLTGGWISYVDTCWPMSGILKFQLNRARHSLVKVKRRTDFLIWLQSEVVQTPKLPNLYAKGSRRLKTRQVTKQTLQMLWYLLRYKDGFMKKTRRIWENAMIVADTPKEKEEWWSISKSGIATGVFLNAGKLVSERR